MYLGVDPDQLLNHHTNIQLSLPRHLLLPMFHRLVQLPLSHLSIYLQKVDGSWSGWSGTACNNCQCSPVAHSIGLATSRRTCSSPYPLNGGSDCTGSNLRAIVCDRQCSSSQQSVDHVSLDGLVVVSIAMLQYISAKCAEHKRLKNDNDLTGTGSQLNRFPQRACKVSRKKRRYEGHSVSMSSCILSLDSSFV